MTSGVILEPPQRTARKHADSRTARGEKTSGRGVEGANRVTVDEWFGLEFSEVGWREYLLEDGKRELVWDDYTDCEGPRMNQETAHEFSENDGWMLSDGGCKLQEDCGINAGEADDTGQGLSIASIDSASFVLPKAPIEGSLREEDDEYDDEDEGVLVAHDEGGGSGSLEPFPDFSKSTHIHINIPYSS